MAVPPTSRYLVLSLLWCSLSAVTAQAQELVPGAYTPAPVGVNVVTFGLTVNDGDVSFDPSLPVEDAHATLGATIVGGARTLSLAGRFANVSVGLPVVFGNLDGRVAGEFREISRFGQGDVAARLAVNVFGAPAMTPQEFQSYRPSTLLGVSVSVGVPVGQYDPAQAINIGTNRWSVKPEVGVSHRRGRWTTEVDVAAQFFSENTDYYNGGRLEQAPIVAAQLHLIYTYRPAMWVAADGNVWHGGRATVNGRENQQQQHNSRLGVTVAVPIARQQIRIAYNFGAYTTIGGDFKSLGVSYSYAWLSRR